MGLWSRKKRSGLSFSPGIGAYGLPVSRAGADETNVDQRPWVLVFRGTNGDAEFVEAVQADELNGKTYVYLTEQTRGLSVIDTGESVKWFLCGKHVICIYRGEF